jgi:lipopolysaccharide/colanic/teichoic acid biosynthesis glycosyltransferase
MWIAITLPIWLPLMIVIVAVVKVVSPGPVFFRQMRVGYGGKHFMILKFRSMKVNANTNTHESHVEQLIETNRPMTKMDVAGDSRMIPFGWMMRASGLDEIPQIFNVLRGEMSLVGPRPCIPKEFDRYKPEQKRRVEAPPGLTGLWQVKGKNKLTFTQMIELDLQYRDTMSARLDTLIILRTIPAILKQVREAKLKLTARQVNKVEKKEEPAEYGTPAEIGSLGDAN